MNTAFFSSRRIHKTYFSRLAEHLNDSKIIDYKKCVIPSLVSVPTDRILAELVHLMREKRNNPKYSSKSRSFWFLFEKTKYLEAKWLYRCYHRALASPKIKKVIFWNGLKFRQRIASIAAKDLGIQCIYMENGLLPGYTTLDQHGINYFNSVPRDSVFFREYSDGQFHYQKNFSANSYQAEEKDLPEHYIFIPFQVNTDSQVTRFSPWISNMFDLAQKIHEVSNRLGSNSPTFIFKTHPACTQDYTDLIESMKTSKNLIFLQDNKLSTPELIQNADAIITINSTVGIESLLQSKPVITLGQAFYNIEGITLASESQEQLVNSIIKARHWQPDPHILANFFEYLTKEYQIPGRWQDCSTEHLTIAARRIEGI